MSSRGFAARAQGQVTATILVLLPLVGKLLVEMREPRIRVVISQEAMVTQRLMVQRRIKAGYRVVDDGLLRYRVGFLGSGCV